MRRVFVGTSLVAAAPEQRPRRAFKGCQPLGDLPADGMERVSSEGEGDQLEEVTTRTEGEGSQALDPVDPPAASPELCPRLEGGDAETENSLNSPTGEGEEDEEAPKKPVLVTEEMVDRIADEKWNHVNGTYNSDGEWREWNEMTCNVNPSTGERIHILPYV